MFQEIIDKILRHNRRDEKVVTSCEIKNVTFYYPASLRRVQITPKTSTIIMRYLYSPRKQMGRLIAGYTPEDWLDEFSLNTQATD